MSDLNEQNWHEYRWYCVNCGHMVTGYRNKKDKIKVTCCFCGSVMIREIDTPVHDLINVYAPDGQNHI